VHVALLAQGPGKGPTTLGLMYSPSLHLYKRLFPGLESMTLCSQGNSFITVPGLSFIYSFSRICFNTFFKDKMLRINKYSASIGVLACNQERQLSSSRST
jgi:hypothetical protein